MTKYNFYYDRFRNLPIDKLNSALHDACKENDMDLISYLLTSDELNRNAQIKESLLSSMCFYDNIKLIEYLLKLSASKKESQIDLHVNATVKGACKYGKMEIIKYLFDSSEFKEHIDLHFNDDKAFIEALISENIEILKYLIVEQNLDKNERIEYALSKLPNEYIEKLFESKVLNQELSRELNKNEVNVRKNKI
jgi:ankyrin repeat protein